MPLSSVRARFAPAPVSIPIPDLKFKVLDLLCQANDMIDDIVAMDKFPVGAGLAPAHALPKIEPASIQHHVVALAGFLKRTSATSITASVGGIIVTARRAR